MSEHGNLYNFFIADYYRIIVNIIILLSVISFIIIMRFALKRKREHFKLIFILMINVIVSAVGSGIGYLLDWKTGDIDNKGSLIFESEILCTTQAILLGFFHISRESFLLLLTIFIFINYKYPYFNLEHNKMIYNIFIYSFGYGIPCIINIIYTSLGAYGESDLFCFTTNNEHYLKRAQACGIIHFAYVFILVIINLILTIYILIKDSLEQKKNSIWLETENNLSPVAKKMLLYPISSLIFLIAPLYYRITSYMTKDGTDSNSNMAWRAGLCATFNSLSSIFNNIIFIISNNLLCSSQQRNEDENMSDNGSIELSEKIMDIN